MAQLAWLTRLAGVGIQSWNYKFEDASVRHIGPMAQDFAAAFAVGADDKHIHPVDSGGVAFAAIQALYRIIREQGRQIGELRDELDRLREGVADSDCLTFDAAML